MGTRLRVAIVLGACALSACQLLLGIEGRDVAVVSDATTESSAADGPPSDADGGDAVTDGDAGPTTCPVGMKTCGADCADTTTSARHCGGCDHACGDAGCDGGFCIVEPEIVLLSLSNHGYFAANASFFFITEQTGTFTFSRKTLQAQHNRPYAPGNTPLDGFEANDEAVYFARLLGASNGVSRMKAPEEIITTIRVGPDFGPPSLGLRLVGGLFLFASGDELYGGVDGTGNDAGLLATLTDLTPAITRDPPTPAPASIWITNVGGEIYKVPVAGGTPTLFATGVPSAVLAAATSSYRIFASRSAVWSLDTTKSPPAPVLIFSDADPKTFISDLRAIGAYVYILDRGEDEGVSGRLVRVPASGGDPLVLLKGISAPLNLYVEAGLAYTLDRGRDTPSPHTVKVWGIPR